MKLRSLFILKIFICLLFLCPSSYGSKIEKHIVKWVIDGDTIIIDTGEKVRYAGINAPEIPHKDQPGEPWGREALRVNIDLVKGKKVILQLAEQDRDRYGRILAYVFLSNNILVQEVMIKKGLAFVCYNPPNLAYWDRLLKDQKEAIRNKVGIWQDPILIYPQLLLGNKASRRFHLLDCPWGQKIFPQNRIIFKNMKQAFLAGYCPCRKCHPWPGKIIGRELGGRNGRKGKRPLFH